MAEVSFRGAGDLHLHDLVRVDALVEGREAVFRGSIIGVRAPELWVGLPSPDLRLDALIAGQPVGVAAPAGAESTVIDTSFARHIGQRRDQMFALAYPGSPRATRRREHARFELALLVEITASLRGRLCASSGQTMDIGAGGASFASDLRLRRGDFLSLRVRMGSATISAEAEILRVGPTCHTLGRPARCFAVRFTHVSGWRAEWQHSLPLAGG